MNDFGLPDRWPDPDAPSWINFDRLEELTGLPLLPWQRRLVQQVADHPGQLHFVAARRQGFTAMARSIQVLWLEPWRLPDCPRWPRFVLVPLPARLERALDQLLTNPPWRTR